MALLWCLGVQAENRESRRISNETSNPIYPKLYTHSSGLRVQDAVAMGHWLIGHPSSLALGFAFFWV